MLVLAARVMMMLSLDQYLLLQRLHVLGHYIIVNPGRHGLECAHLVIAERSLIVVESCVVEPPLLADSLGILELSLRPASHVRYVLPQF